MQDMSKGVDVNGNALEAGKLAYSGIFTTSGLFFQQWPAAIAADIGYGSSPIESFFGALGHKAIQYVPGSVADVTNLLICESTLNNVKGTSAQRPYDLQGESLTSV